MSYSFLIAVTPPEKLFNEIVGIKESIKKKYGIQYATTHIPHLSIFLNSFASFKDVDEEINKIIPKIRPFKVDISGISYFGKDSLTYGTTIFLKVKKTKELDNIHKLFLERLNHLRTNDQMRWLNYKKENFSPHLWDFVQKYGYPYVLENYLAHISIDSVKKENFEVIWNKIKKYNPKLTFTAKQIDLYIWLHPDSWVLLRSYKLK